MATPNCKEVWEMCSYVSWKKEQSAALATLEPRSHFLKHLLLWCCYLVLFLSPEISFKKANFIKIAEVKKPCLAIHGKPLLLILFLVSILVGFFFLIYADISVTQFPHLMKWVSFFFLHQKCVQDFFGNRAPLSPTLCQQQILHNRETHIKSLKALALTMNQNGFCIGFQGKTHFTSDCYFNKWGKDFFLSHIDVFFL